MKLWILNKGRRRRRRCISLIILLHHGWLHWVHTWVIPVCKQFWWQCNGAVLSSDSHHLTWEHFLHHKYWSRPWGLATCTVVDTDKLLTDVCKVDCDILSEFKCNFIQQQQQILTKTIWTRLKMWTRRFWIFLYTHTHTDYLLKPYFSHFEICLSRKRRERVSMCVCTYVCICVCVCVCMFVCVCLCER